MKQYLILILLALLSCEAIGQQIDTNLLIGTWSSGEYNENDSIVRVGLRKGGPIQMTFTKDSVYYSTGFNCGFGRIMKGTWSSNLDTIVLNFSVIEAYRDYPEFDPSPEVLKFTVEYITKHGLIIRRNSGSEELYCKI